MTSFERPNFGEKKITISVNYWYELGQNIKYYFKIHLLILCQEIDAKGSHAISLSI